MRTAKPLVSAALTALAGLTAVSAASTASAAAPAPAPAPAPKPPVITEQFNPPFTCNQQSNLGVQGCAEGQVDRADARINAEVKVLFRTVYDNASRRDLVTAESAWLAYRTADCTSQSDVYEGGTEQPVAFLLCLAEDDQSRSADLKGFYLDLTQGRSHVPPFP
ncbi:MAG: lysozyme inhibitor LprI family protein [Acidimicrobiales bacterium]